MDALSADMRKKFLAAKAARAKYNGEVLVEDDRVTVECVEACDRARSAAHRAQICIVEAQEFLESHRPTHPSIPMSRLQLTPAKKVSTHLVPLTRPMNPVIPFSTGLGKVSSLT